MYVSKVHDMISLHVLGTSSAKPTKDRSVSGSFLNGPAGSVLIDCGEGMQQRIAEHDRWLRSIGSNERTKLSKIKAIYLTHAHLDHCWGVLPMLHSMDKDGRKSKLEIHGPTSTAALNWIKDRPGEVPDSESGIYAGDLAIQFDWWEKHGGKNGAFQFEVEWILYPVDQIDTSGIIISNVEGMCVQAYVTNHLDLPSFGYLFSTPELPGKFDRSAAIADGHNEESIREIALDSSKYRGPKRPSRSILISGDTTPDVPSFVELKTSIDVLIHESTFDDSLQSKAASYGHSTARDAASLASHIGANFLGLTHFSSRFQDVSHLEDEAKSVFDQSHALNDGDRISIGLDGLIHLERKGDEEWVSIKQLLKS